MSRPAATVVIGVGRVEVARGGEAGRDSHLYERPFPQAGRGGRGEDGMMFYYFSIRALVGRMFALVPVSVMYVGGCRRG